MRLTVPAISIDSNNPAYPNSHTLTTSATSAFGNLIPANHCITLLDQYVPKGATRNANAVFSNVWEYLLTN